MITIEQPIYEKEFFATMDPVEYEIYEVQRAYYESRHDLAAHRYASQWIQSIRDKGIAGSLEDRIELRNRYFGGKR